jgi:hypothetical protein
VLKGPIAPRTVRRHRLSRSERLCIFLSSRAEIHRKNDVDSTDQRQTIIMRQTISFSVSMKPLLR